MAVARIPSPIVNWTNSVGADFLRIDSQVALTFSGMALAATDEEIRGRTALVARKAYDTIARLREHIELTDAERDKLDANLRRVQTELQSLGQTLSPVTANGLGIRMPWRIFSPMNRTSESSLKD
jgi:hypothetical protein